MTQNWTQHNFFNGIGWKRISNDVQFKFGNNNTLEINFTYLFSCGKSEGNWSCYVFPCYSLHWSHTLLTKFYQVKVIMRPSYSLSPPISHKIYTCVGSHPPLFLSVVKNTTTYIFRMSSCSKEKRLNKSIRRYWRQNL